MAAQKVYYKQHPTSSAFITVSDQLPDKEGGHGGAQPVAVCKTFAKALGLSVDTLDAKEWIEAEITAKETARYALKIETPWEKKTA